jgi:hypothetical protein
MEETSRRMERFYYTSKSFKNTVSTAERCSFKRDVRMIMYGKMERLQEKWLWFNSKYYSNSYLEELWEIMENLSPRLRPGYLPNISQMFYWLSIKKNDHI